MTLTRAAGMIASIALVWVAGCNKTSVLPTQLTESQRTVAVAALTELRLVYNQSDCKAIYDRAAEHFRLQPSGTWADRCRELRSNLGAWQSFNAESVNRCSPRDELVCMRGTGSFRNGDHRMEAILQIETGQARLVSLS